MLSIIVSAILISTLLNIFLKRYDIPTIIGYIATGTIIAYVFKLHTAVNNHDLREIAEFGIVFLMFTIGLEFSFASLKKMRREVFLNGTLQVALSTTFFALVSVYVLNFDLKTALVISSALSLSSTAIVLKILNETDDINKPYGRHVLAILLLQDIAVIPILLMITMFSSVDQPIALLLLETVFGAIVLLVILGLSGKYILDRFFALASSSGSSEIFIASVLLIVMGASFLAHSLGFSYSFGAFIAGMTLAETRFKEQVEADLIPFRDLLLGIFFITVGMQIDFSIIFENLWKILMFLPLIMASKVLITYFIIRYVSTTRTALKTALSLFQVGEFSLAVFELARSGHLLSESVGQILIVVVVLSMILTPFVLNNISFLADKIIEQEIEDEEVPSYKIPKLKNHTIVIGYGHLGKQVVRLLKQGTSDYIVIDNNPKLIEKARAHSIPIIFGNGALKDTLESVNIAEASSIIVTIENSQKLELISSTIDTMDHNAYAVVKVNRKDEKSRLKKFHLGHVIVQDDDTADKMVHMSFHKKLPIVDHLN